VLWIKRFASSLRGGRLEEELDQELEFHLTMRAREKTAAGATAEEARRQVLHRFGSVTRTKEACRRRIHGCVDRRAAAGPSLCGAQSAQESRIRRGENYQFSATLST
jgi:hypothetical protein